MPVFYISIVVTMLSSVAYHVFQKATPPNVNPALGLMVIYTIALLLSLLLLFFFPLRNSLSEALREVN